MEKVNQLWYEDYIVGQFNKNKRQFKDEQQAIQETTRKVNQVCNLDIKPKVVEELVWKYMNKYKVY